MKRFIHLLVCVLVAAAMILPARAEPGGALWTREEAGGAYVTVRVPFPEGEGMSWGQTRYLGVRYAGTGEPVALTSDYKAGYLFATVPARDADRPLEVFQGERFHWTDIQYQNEPVSANTLYIRSVLHGDGEGRLNLEQVLTRAEAFSLLVRLLDLEEGGDPGYGDVAPSDWYYSPVSAARAAGLAAADKTFRPNDSVSRAEFNTMVYRAFRSVGWIGPERGEAQDYVDSADIPDWALEAYRALGSLSISTVRELDESGESEPEIERLAQPGQGVTRREAVGLIASALDRLPVYPTQAAIDRGFDRAMPVIDGSTSTYPYTDALYSALFHNAGRHPELPASHSKSHASYERLIRGEVDVLFAATKASIELEEQAKTDKAAHEKELAQVKLVAAVDAELTAAGSKNNTAVRAILADFLAGAKVVDGKVTGKVNGESVTLAARIEAMKKDTSTDFMFGSVQREGWKPGEGGDSGKPAGGKKPSEMSYAELAEYLAANPDAKLD